MNVLALNSGSSSLKFGVGHTDARVGGAFEWRFEGQIESIGGDDSRLSIRDSHDAVVLEEREPVADAASALERIERWFADSSQPPPDVIGHRVVHGGPALRRHCIIDGAVMRQLDDARAFAPLHVPPALAVIRIAQARFPVAVQAACFDTAFHATLPDVASTLPIAREWRDRGVQRYGFHGLSCESILRQLGVPPSRLVIAHLGSGASITAVKDGRSVDTSMGMTPSGGVMMGTRSGDLDPGVLIYLMREKHFDADGLEQLIDHDSGLRGVSGLSNDMRKLHEAAASNADADLAIRLFCRTVCKQIAAMATVLEGIDLLILTGGIGENDASVRDRISRGLDWLQPGFETRVLPSREDQEIAIHASRLAVGATGSRR